jgi:hypothetical protein
MNDLEIKKADLTFLFKKVQASKNNNPVVKDEESREEKIKRLHLETSSYLTIALWKAVEIGQLLTEQKEELKHGEFMPWIKANMPFSTATARNYMRLWERREDLKLLTVSNLKTAYKVVKETLPSTHLEFSGNSIFDSPKYPDPFSHCDDMQKRKWIARWILDSTEFDHPLQAWDNMSWWAVRYTFDEYFNPERNGGRCKIFNPPAVNICEKVKKEVNEFLEKHKNVDLLKLKFTCLSFYQMPEENVNE